MSLPRIVGSRTGWTWGERRPHSRSRAQSAFPPSPISIRRNSGQSL